MAIPGMQIAAGVMRQNWPAELLQLAVLLGAGDHAAREKIAALHQAEPPLGEVTLREEMQRLVAATVATAAQAQAAALGCSETEIVNFAAPDAEGRILEGRNAWLYRLDRCWGGPSEYSLRARTEFVVLWPSPISTEVLALSGTVSVNGITLGDHECATLGTGKELRLAPRALVLLRRPAIGVLLEAARLAGMDVPALVESVTCKRLLAQTAVGALWLDAARKLAVLHERDIRLSDNEVAVLRELMQRPGRVTDRKTLSAAVGLSGERTLDRVMMGLRNKLGDGVVSTVYGVGYALEAS